MQGDGIYFQTFTETDQEKIGDKVIAEEAVKLVNRTAGTLLEKYPELEIQFGLHATSVKDKLQYLEKVDKRVLILWEDCGAFPYAYIPKKTEHFEETLAFTSEIANLRGQADGVLFKGMSVLDWSTFQHQPGTYIIGEYDRNFIGKRTEQKREIWKYLQAYWISNAAYVKRTVETLQEDHLVAALVEDGMFEKNVWYPVALYAEILWDPHRKMEEVMAETALIPDVKFA